MNRCVVKEGYMVRKIRKDIYYEIVFAVLAIVAVSIAALDIMGNVSLEKPSVLYYVDFSILIIFIGDYFIRLYLAQNRKNFMKNNIPDLIAIIPFNRIFKIFRIIKLVRLLKIARISKLTKLSRFFVYSFRIFRKSERFLKTNGLIYALSFTVFIILVSSIAISYFENMSLPDSIWWSFVTATTVGYGDLSPSSSGGRVVAAVLMLVGIGTIGMLTGTIATYFLISAKKTLSDNEFEKYILETNELLDSEKTELINYYRFIKSKREEEI